MRTYALISQKGGAGKSTLALQLAVVASEEGPSFIIDRDLQGTATKWWKRRTAEDDAPEWPDLLDIGRTSLIEAHKAVKDRPGSLFIDTRPAVSEAEAEAARVADVAIVPVRPSINDLEAVGETLAILRSLERPTVIVINSAKGEPRARDARAVLSRYGVPVCPHTLIDRTAYNDAAALGAGVGEVRGAGAKQAHDEVMQVWKWINEVTR